METLYQKYRSQGFIVLQLKAENNSGSTPSQSDLSGWASTYGLTFPVLADSGWGVMSRFERDNYIPSHTLIAPGLEVVERDGNISEADIMAVLP